MDVSGEVNVFSSGDDAIDVSEAESESDGEFPLLKAPLGFAPSDGRMSR